ncbi:MAG TPA: ATP-binding protein [bacterium]|nr:ATP-binding protein [bacterium]
MIVIVIIITSVLLQLIATVAALKMIRISGRYMAWTLISAALAIMIIRRCISFNYSLSYDPEQQFSIYFELLGLLISAFMLIGIIKIHPIFIERKRNEEELRLDESRMLALLHINQMTEASVQEIIDFCIKKAVQLTGSRIGYFIFLNDNEEVSSVHSWPGNSVLSSGVEGGAEMPEILSEALRQRKPVIVNGQDASSWKGNGNRGHREKAARRMQAPLLYDKRIVLVAGVEDKDHEYKESDLRQITLLMQGMWNLIQRRKVAAELQKHRENLEELVKTRTAELETAKEAAEAADRLKSVFLASMSHELRTPLNSILGFTGIILMGMTGDLNEEQKKQLTMVKNSAEHLLSLINDVLDISKIEAGRVDLSSDEFDVKDVVKEVNEIISTAADEKGLEIITEITGELNMLNDRRRVKQVLMNLVSNAVKFTEKGSVKISAAGGDDGFVNVCVTDTGSGISKENMQLLFKPFRQVGDDIEKKSEGTGLGLHLCWKLVELLGGDIRAESELGKGSAFMFNIPLKREEPAV